MSELFLRSIAVADLPEYKTSEEFDLTFCLPSGSTEKRTGVSTRFIATGESLPDLAARSVKSALSMAGFGPPDLDLLIFAAASSQQPIPSTASLVLNSLGKKLSVPCFDLDATCLSFLQALETATALIETGRYETIAIVTAEKPTTFLNPSCQATAPLFGDGSATCILSSRTGGVKLSNLKSSFETHSEHSNSCTIKGGGLAAPAFSLSKDNQDDFYFKMQGKQLYAAAAQHLPQFLNTFLKRHKLSLSRFDKIIPHQASGTAIRLLTRRLGLSPQQVVNIVQNHGNQVAASIPIALHHAMKEYPSGSFLLLGTGAGLGLGAISFDLERL